ncbi:CAP domain-containing protein [Circinella umbellata]|nr:CAP domain-containing protein [Circinella umbellata]
MPAPSTPSKDSPKPSDLPSHDNKKEQQPTGSSASGTSSEVLDLHNQFRAKHSAPPLVWDATLAAYAQKWSDRCVFEHSSGSYGENLAQGFPDWEGVVTAWYDENTEYDYSKPGFTHGIGHFTQLVWVGTTKLGCAVADCNGNPLYTCSYDPPGNVVNGDAFKTNVLPN